MSDLQNELITAAITAVVADETDRLRKEFAELRSALARNALEYEARSNASETRVICAESEANALRLKLEAASECENCPRLRDILYAVGKRLDGRDRQISALRSELATAKRELDPTTDEYQHLLARLRAELAESSAEIAAMTKHFTTLEAENERWSTELTDAVNARNVALEKVDSLEVELAEAERHSQEQKARHDADYARLARRTDAEQAVLDACAGIPDAELHNSGNWYGWAKPIGEAVRALREAAQ